MTRPQTPGLAPGELAASKGPTLLHEVMMNIMFDVIEMNPLGNQWDLLKETVVLLETEWNVDEIKCQLNAQVMGNTSRPFCHS